MREGTCIHFNGLGNDCCAAGVKYREAFGKEDGIALRMPCIQFRIYPTHRRGTYVKAGEATVREEIDRRGSTEIPCETLQLPTAEQIEQSRRERDAHMEKMRVVGAFVSEWRKKPPRGKQEVVECPACKGRLHLSQAACNGHVWGKCETAGCVNWME